MSRRRLVGGPTDSERDSRCEVRAGIGRVLAAAGDAADPKGEPFVSAITSHEPAREDYFRSGALK